MSIPALPIVVLNAPPYIPVIPTISLTQPEYMSRSSSSSTLVDNTSSPIDKARLFESPPSPPLATPIILCDQCNQPLPVSSDNSSQLESAETKASPDLKVATITNPIKSLLKESLAKLETPIKIVGLLATPDSGCRTYADMTAKSCKNVGVEFVKLDLCCESDVQVGFEDVKMKIEEVNNDLGVDGLIVYFPLFGIEKDDQLRQLISPRIDVEGVHSTNLSQTYAQAAPLISELDFTSSSNSVVYPCTPLAVLRVLQALKGGYDTSKPVGKRLEGKTVMVINRSETVGRPLAAMLTNEGALTYSVDISSTQVHHQTTNGTCIRTITTPQSNLLSECDIIISAVPGERYKVPTTHLKHGVICVDLSEKGNFESDIGEKAGCWAPRIGAVTILMLQFNALILRGRARSASA